jgi:glycosyltransferase involved in cell wall biosynthesis
MKFAEVILANIDNNEDYIISNVKQIHINPRINFFKLPNPFNYPDLIVFHEVYYWQYIFISAQLRKLKIPYIIIPHGSLTDNAQKYKLLKKKIGNNFFFNKFINGAKAIQYLSKNELENSNFGKMKFVGSNGVEIPHNYKINFNVDKIIITFIGRLNIYYKGLDLLLN